MNISVEISMYPLQPTYETPILKFIEALHQYEGLTVQTNTMSTQIFGKYETVMNALNGEIMQSFLTDPTIIMVIKIVNKDLSSSL